MEQNEPKCAFLEFWASGTKEASHFLCGICLQILHAPLQCPKCFAMYCEGCIKSWISRTNQCPQCRTRSPNFEKLNPVVLQILNEMEVICPNHEQGCMAIVEYGKLADHLKLDCEYVEMKCCFQAKGCKFSGPKISLQKHIEEECKYAMKCSICQGKLLPKSDPHRDCVISLMDELKLLNQDLTRTQSRVKSFVAMYGALPTIGKYVEEKKEEEPEKVAPPREPRKEGTRVECLICGRMFEKDRIEKHSNACKKVSKKRTEFNSSLQRCSAYE